MTRLQKFIDRCEACYLRRKGFAVRLVIIVSGSAVDIEVQHNEAGLHCLLREPGILASNSAMDYIEATQLNAWIKGTFWAIVD